MPVGFSLLSVQFLGLAVAAVLSVGLLRGRARAWVFLFINVYFVGRMLLGLQGLVSSFLFCLVGYGFARAILKRKHLAYRLLIPVYVGMFVYMRNYDILHWVAPEFVLTGAFATVGLSFLLFRVVHVMIEAASGTSRPLEFLTFINYCFSFTTFMMGPIQRYDDFHDQWHGRTPALAPTLEAHLDAVIRILVGLLKAYVLAVWVQPFALLPGTDVLTASVTQLWVGVYAFWFFLYLNFSGYCDVVIGVGSLLGVRPPENFDKPFLARNISDFWLRQHRSLTLWLTDYVFSPLYKWALTSESVLARPAVAVNVSLVATMVVSGLWHGTTLAFLFFGLAHAAFLVVYHNWNTFLTHRFGKKRVRVWRQNGLVHAGGIILTFHATALAFVFFNLPWNEAFTVFGRLLGR